MGKRSKAPKARCKYETQIKMTLSSYDRPITKATVKPRLELEPIKPAAGAKPRNPAAHPWRYTGVAKGRIFRDIDPVPFDRNKDVPYGVCFNCWQYDHHQGNCPETTIDDHCQNCGRIGVKVSNCPRCRRAYQVYHKKNKIQPASDDSSMVRKEEKQEKGVEKSEEEEWEDFPAELLTEEHDDLAYNEGFANYERFCCEEEPPHDEYDDLTKIFVDESMSGIITGDFLDNFLNFIEAIKYLPAKKRTEVAQTYLLQHRKQLRQESLEE